MAAPNRLSKGGTYAARPTSSFGYWRGGMSDGPLAQNQGSFAYGQANSGAGLFPQGSGPSGAAAAWSPTLTYLFVFIVAEMILFKLLGRVLR
jgi:hypothetical protein